MRTQSTCLALAIVLLCPVVSGQWVKTSFPDSLEVSCLAVSGTNLFAGTNGGVFVSTDNGASWTAVNEGLTDTDVNALAVSGTNLFAGTYGGAFLSTNNGTIWTLDTVGMGICSVGSIAVSGPSVFVESFHNIFVSTDNGNSWSAIGDGLPYVHSGWEGGGSWLSALAVDGTNVFAGVVTFSKAWGIISGDGVVLSTDYGASWTWVNDGLTDLFVQALAISGTYLFAGTDTGGVFLSTNNGTSWTQTSLQSGGVESFAICGPNLFAGTGCGVYLSTNNGTSWTQVNTGLLDSGVTNLAIGGTNLFAGTGSGVWRRPLTEMITSVEGLSPALPREFTLWQNYPNPLNPSTTIKYQLPKSSEVRVSVFDMLGREVSVMVNERKNAGVHEVKFDGSTLASGVYFYRLQAGDFVQSKRLVLLK